MTTSRNDVREKTYIITSRDEYLGASRDNECDRHNHSVHRVVVYEPVLWPEVTHHKSEEPCEG